MTAPMDPDDPNRPPLGVEDPEERSDRRVAFAIVAVLVVAVLAGLLWWLLSDDDDEVTSTTTSVPTSESTTTSSSTAPSSTTTEAPFDPTLSDEELATVIWLYQDTSQRFSDPSAAVYSFATDLLGFTDPIIGEFAAGDSRSGEVEVRAAENGPATTVSVRQLGDDSWWVLGAQTPDILLEQPESGATVSSPLQVTGRSRAFEGTVDVAVLRDGDTEPIGSGFVTGGANEQLGPFSGEVQFDPADAEWGALALTTTSAEDGRVWQATVIRVRFG